MSSSVNYTIQIDNAARVPVLKNPKTGSEHAKTLIQASVSLFALVCDENKYGNLENERHNKIMAHINTITTGGMEPSGELLHFWYYPILASAFAIAKRTPTIWDKIEDNRKKKIDLIMKAFAIGSNYISNDANDYKTGLAMKGDVHKNRPPNFRLSLIGPIIPCVDYFGGADALDEMFANFDYDSFIDEMEDYGYVNMLKVWTTPSFERDGEIFNGAKELLMNGGEACIKEPTLGTFNVYSGGFGKGARIPYLYKGFRADTADMINALIEYVYSGGAIASSFGLDDDGNPKTYIIDHSTSPYEGLDGLMLEFNTTDSGFRSDANYCEVDFIMTTSILLAAKIAGLWNEEQNKAVYSKVWNGSRDLMYKLETGFRSFSLNNYHTSIETNISGYRIMKEVFNDFFAEI